MTASESWILSYLVNSLWQAPLLFAAGLIAARLLRPAGAEAEHRVWVGVLFLQSVLPACSTAEFGWLHALLIWSASDRSPGSAQVTVVMGKGIASGVLPFLSPALAALAIAYGAITLYFAARFIWRASHLHAMRRDSVLLVPAGESARRWNQCSRRFGIRNPCLATSSRVFAPVTMGVFRKLLLLPAGFVSSITDTEMESVIAHEFAHMRRNDFVKNLAYELIALPASYHPALWFTRARITESREMICDRMAADLAGCGPYTRSLLRLASLVLESAPASVAPALGIFDSNTLERRLMKLAEKPSQLCGLRRFAAIAGCLALGAATCASALSLHVQVNGANASGHQPTTHPAYVNVSPKTMQNQIINKVTPKYPLEAKKARIEGKVVLGAVIDREGYVKSLKVESGPKELQQSALDAVRQWKYKPYLLNGEPVEVRTTINITYTLEKKK